MIGQAGMKTPRSKETMEDLRSSGAPDYEEPEGLDDKGESLGNYPIDDLLIRHDSRTIHDVIRRIDQGNYVMDPDFQRDFIWPEDKQSKLIESVIMRIPLPVFYMAEDGDGRMVVVDGLQRLSTFQRFVKDDLRLRLPDRTGLNGKRFSDLSSKLQNRVEDCNLIFYTIDSKVGERARLDIFERVNSGEPLSRQQMRNCLFVGRATRFMKEEARTKMFLEATGGSLNEKTMRDREFVNRFCAFQILDLDEYHGDMDDFLAHCLTKLNRSKEIGALTIVRRISQRTGETTSCCSISMRSESTGQSGDGGAFSMRPFGTSCQRVCRVTPKNMWRHTPGLSGRPFMSYWKTRSSIMRLPTARTTKGECGAGLK